MKPVNLLLQLALILLLTACGGGGSSSNPVAPPSTPEPEPEPEPTGFDYSFSGTAVKGVIRGAGVTVLDADGNPVEGATAVTDGKGGYDISFTSGTELQTPLMVVVDGTSATVVCDRRPTCDPGAGPDGPLDPVPFGETYLLPAGFKLRAAIESIETDETGATRAKAYVSPLSEFVVDAALKQSGTGRLTTDNLNTANTRVVALVKKAFPTLNIADGVRVSSIPLVDVTDLENADLNDSSDLSLVISSVNAAVIGFVDANDEERSDISRVVENLSETISDDTGDPDAPLSGTVEVALVEEAVKSLDETVVELKELEQAGTVTLPPAVVLDELEDISEEATNSLADAENIVTTLSASEMVTPVASGAVGSARLLYLKETGEAEAIVTTGGINATAVHLHQGYAAGTGDILIELERNSQGAWTFPADTRLDASTLAALAEGGTYFDVHSNAFPDGEIRGQVIPPGIQVYRLRPSGAEQAPQPVSSGAFALAAITLNPATRIAQVQVSVTDRTVLEASLRQGAGGAVGQVLVNLRQSGVNARHWFSPDVDFSDVGVVLDQGRLYLNIATTVVPAGELRSQILPPGFQMNTFSLEAAQVVADEPVESSNTGLVTVTSNPGNLSLTAHTNLFGISSPLGVQMNVGASGEDGVVLFNLSPDSLFQFMPQSAGVSHWYVLDRTLSQDEFQAFQTGQFFVQVSTAAFPAGELRGQLGGVTPIDSDGDGVANSEDAFPLDPEETRDTDGDGVGDNGDVFPEDPDETKDTDGDGVGDNGDVFPNDPTESKDSDNDGTGDNADQCPNDPTGTRDEDGDGVCDVDPDSVDTDGDGVPDTVDAFPLDDTETTDTDGDGVGDNGDAFPEDENESVDTDGDGVGDNSDVFPNNPNETTDSDGDGVGDNSDVFPQNASESADSDGDGVGDNADAFPNDPNEFLDSDGDGVGNNSDAFPNDPNESVDADNDGIGDNADTCVVTSDPDNPNADDDGIVRDCAEVVSFSAVKEIFEANCVECHGSSGGLDLTSGQAYSQLVNVPSQDIPSLDRVEPGSSDQSYLVWKLEGRDGILGTIQPPSGRLEQSDIDQIKSWIDNGADP